MQVTSSDFEHNAPVPRRFTCEGEDISPQLSWGDLPHGTVELAISCEDPDAPGKTFVHWVAWGIDPAAGSLAVGEAPPGQGRNDFGRRGYGGPCPPPGHGPHHYEFVLYALGERLELPAGASLDELRAAMQGKVLDQASLVGTYER
jgi:Raf kinase inhibitor-like YbhB/YbcL family protein